MKPVFFLVLTILGIFGWRAAFGGDKETGPTVKESYPEPGADGKVELTDAQWQERLTPMEYKVLRKAGTERAFTGDFWDNKAEGVYTCGGCGQELFASGTKFKSGTGWPSYFAPVNDEAVGKHVDRSWGMTRTEVHCSRCGGHLGHVFPDGPEPTGLRYCINGAALDFKAKDGAVIKSDK